MKAAEKGHANVVSALMDLEANINLQNSVSFSKIPCSTGAMREYSHN
jgi:hypothetical protein